MKIAVSQQIFLIISTALYLVELYVAVFGLLLAYGRTDGQTEIRRHSARIKMCQKIINQIWSDRKEGILLSFNAKLTFFSLRVEGLAFQCQNLYGCENFKQIETFKNFLYLINPLNPELNPICYLLALLGAYHFLHFSRIRVKLLTFRLLMSYIYIYGAPILDVSRSHTTTQHSR